MILFKMKIFLLCLHFIQQDIYNIDWIKNTFFHKYIRVRVTQ